MQASDGTDHVHESDADMVRAGKMSLEHSTVQDCGLCVAIHDQSRVIGESDVSVL